MIRNGIMILPTTLIENKGSIDIFQTDTTKESDVEFSTSKIEELIYDLKKNYTIIIVTHNMQQAARVSDRTAFFYLGELVECDETKTIFTNPKSLRTQNYITGKFG